MAKKTFRCTLVTPTTSLVDEEVTYASVPAWDGLFGVLPGRAPILARLGTGELRLAFPDSAKAGGGEGGERSFLVDGGFVQMAGETLTILAERAFAAEALSENFVTSQLKEAEAKAVPADATDKQAAKARIDRERSVARAALKLVRAKKGI